MSIEEFLKKVNPELYDLKDEKGYSGNDSLEKMLEYKRKNDGFDCDGTLGKNYCKLIREIYRMLWDWDDIIDDNHVKRYAKTCIGDEILMGPETINSFQKTYSTANKLGMMNNKNNREMFVTFTESVGRIGNMTLTYKGFNKYVAYDYWDIKIKKQYLDNKSLSKNEKIRYVNLFFHWDYVTPSKNSYDLKTFWDGHEKYYTPKENNIPNYIMLVDLYTKRRGIFMIGMLHIASKCKKDYELIRNKILMSDNIFKGYEDVISQAIKLNYCNSETCSILSDLLVCISADTIN